MTDNVIPLSKPERQIWVCACGCCSFELLSDGYARCANCGNESIEDGQGWYEDVIGGQQRDPDLEPPVSDIQGNGSDEFVRQRMARRIVSAEASAIAIAYADGTVTSWSAAETIEQADWARERFEAAAEMIRKNVGEDPGDP